jgi:hypothetical protein
MAWTVAKSNKQIKASKQAKKQVRDGHGRFLKASNSMGLKYHDSSPSQLWKRIEKLEKQVADLESIVEKIVNFR